ncbi:hypothetical protein PV328_007081 [Microctonus aethiopoides]|uniref:DNA 3'-5' helicase n=1 Tax=Microctonus aethiopoides TaxID=144406 RepID=A0AA39FQG9_9HYME|nr:hypothetical protein PV328_007081 [Microctonus aethiopoides]
MDERIKNVMKCVFGFTTFISQQQRDGVLAVLKGDGDVFINLPPAGGKSLCYQLPAILSPEKTTIVFVRNNNVAQEHVNVFIGKNVNVSHIDSSLRPKKKLERIEQLKSGKSAASLIYIPISLCNKSWIKDLITLLGNNNLISTFVIDEAIYFSSNSLYFNKSSLHIISLRKMFPNVPLVVLTACASRQIKHDIFDALSMKNPCEILGKKWILPNTHLRVKFKDIIPNPFEDLVETIEKYKKTDNKFSGIIFCRTKEETIIVARELSQLNISTIPYNANMKNLDRKKHKSMWKVGKVAMIATTRDSAIGLDKPNISCIIHWSVPSSITEYYYEIGKAKRTYGKAMCCLYFSLDDWMYIKKLTMGMSSYAYDNSEKMIQFCLSEGCRHAMYLRYFDSAAYSCRIYCDWCDKRDDVEQSLQAFNHFQTQHRLLSIRSRKTTTVNSQLGIYNLQNTDNIIKKLRPQLRFYWYKNVTNALMKNYKMASCSNKKGMSIQNLCRLARNLEFSQLLSSYSRATYIFAMSNMVCILFFSFIFNLYLFFNIIT